MSRRNNFENRRNGRDRNRSRSPEKRWMRSRNQNDRANYPGSMDYYQPYEYYGKFDKEYYDNFYRQQQYTEQPQQSYLPVSLNGQFLPSPTVNYQQHYQEFNQDYNNQYKDNDYEDNYSIFQYPN